MIVCVLGGLFFLLRPDNRAAGPQERTFEISVVDGEMSPEGISAREGDRVTISIESGEPIELHLHGYDVEREVGPGEPGRLSFEADLTGRFEFENDETEEELGELQVRPVNQTLGLLLDALFLGAYLGFVGLSRVLGDGRGFGRFAAAYAFLLVPIAVAYQVAHYNTLLLVHGQAFVARLSDPFGYGWNLFGTAGFQPRYGLVGAGFVWYSQVALIVAGHVVAVYLAHLISLRLLRDLKRAMLSQLPMLVLIVLYTVSSLWIVAKPSSRG
ncbi:MAG TPA: cupredoxin domain-containing protein [Rubrobacter sp.]|nr:cupredoxin domain-containing protein [Rubrobacter sp.]